MAKSGLQGADKVIKKLRNARELKGVRRQLRAGAVHVKGKMARYPASTSSDQGPGSYWYERGDGAKYHRVSGGISSYGGSQTLGRRWTTKTRNSGLTAIIGNNADYAGYVQSAEKQSATMRRIGWQTDKQVLDAEGPIVMALIQKEINKLLSE